MVDDSRTDRAATGQDELMAAEVAPACVLARLFDTGYDFCSLQNGATVLRRIRRRIAGQRTADMPAYLPICVTS